MSAAALIYRLPRSASTGFSRSGDTGSAADRTLLPMAGSYACPAEVLLLMGCRWRRSTLML